MSAGMHATWPGWEADVAIVRAFNRLFQRWATTGDGTSACPLWRGLQAGLPEYTAASARMDAALNRSFRRLDPQPPTKRGK